MLRIHMGVCLNEGLCDHHMNYVESLEVNYVSIFPRLLSLFNNVEFRTVLVICERFLRFKVFYCLTGGKQNFKRGRDQIQRRDQTRLCLQ